MQRIISRRIRQKSGGDAPSSRPTPPIILPVQEDEDETDMFDDDDVDFLHDIEDPVTVPTKVEEVKNCGTDTLLAMLETEDQGVPEQEKVSDN